jgi:4-amino-4-deoxy-L-arabinose transferase-like glycosyltransferase
MKSTMLSVYSHPIRLALVGIIGLTVWRLALLPLAGLDLFVDESQYWLWGRELAFGHYSKPPMIGWLLRAATEITGSDSDFSIRAALPLVHAATALVLLRLTLALSDTRTAALVAISFLTLPAVSLGSILVSTDTPLMFFLALSVLLWHRLTRHPARTTALFLGVALGLGVMSKYAMAFYLTGFTLVFLFVPAWRIGWRDAALAALAALLVVAPNVAWNLRHEMATLHHTADNAAWAGIRLHLDEAAAFFFAQFAVAGPIIFGGLLIGFSGLLRSSGDKRALILLALPAIVIVFAQALMSHAYANWAVGAYVPGAILAVMVLQNRPVWLRASLWLNGAIAVALPIAVIFAQDIPGPQGKALLHRHFGQGEISQTAFTAVRAHAMPDAPQILVADDRALLADLMYRTTRRDGEKDMRVYAVPHPFPVPHHYALLYALPSTLLSEQESFLFMGFADRPWPCEGQAAAEELLRWRAGPGVHQGREVFLARIAAGCFTQPLAADAK